MVQAARASVFVNGNNVIGSQPDGSWRSWREASRRISEYRRHLPRSSPLLGMSDRTWVAYRSDRSPSHRARCRREPLRALVESVRDDVAPTPTNEAIGNPDGPAARQAGCPGFTWDWFRPLPTGVAHEPAGAICGERANDVTAGSHCRPARQGSGSGGGRPHARCRPRRRPRCATHRRCAGRTPAPLWRRCRVDRIRRCTALAAGVFEVAARTATGGAETRRRHTRRRCKQGSQPVARCPEGGPGMEVGESAGLPRTARSRRTGIRPWPTRRDDGAEHDDGPAEMARAKW